MFGEFLLIAVAQVAAGVPTPAFAVRADPSVAAKIDHVLTRVSEPQLSTVPSGADPRTYVATSCGNIGSPRVISTVPSHDPNTIWVWHDPCLRFRQNREFEVREGSRLEDFAVSAGLRPSSVTSVQVKKKGAETWAPAAAQTLSIGDRVRFPKVPLWTIVKTNATLVATREQLIRLFADELGCKSTDPSACIRQKGVDVVDATAPEARIEPPRIPAPMAMRVAAAPPAIHDETRVASGPAIDSIMESSTMASSALILAPPQPVATAPQPSAPVAAPPEPAAPAASTAAVLNEDIRNSAPVALDQWPYDRKLLAATLGADATSINPVVIGVADAGLARASGDPLPTVAFYRNPGEDPTPNGIDDDGNGYVDDIYGAGMIRHDEQWASGDLGVCEHSPVSFDGLEAARRALADHGPIVASIAAALSERSAAPLVGLPKIVFFRLVDDLCSPGASVNISEAAFVKALEYVFEPANIFVLSYTFGADSTGDFKAHASQELERSDVLLLVPAGNDGPGDIDDDPPCPACLALGNESVDLTAARTLVVGAAARDLTILPASNWGVHLVRLYAPADTSGSIDIAGHDASGRTPATSWATPYAGLAAGILQGFGIERARDIRERLLAATWEIRDPDGKTDPRNSGVVNITAVAAVRHAAIEVVEQNAAGEFERRTYVGSLDTSVADLCPEGTLGKRPHALRFGKESGGQREVLWRSKTFDPQNLRAADPLWSAGC
jgi:hypothetical protein